MLPKVLTMLNNADYNDLRSYADEQALKHIDMIKHFQYQLDSTRSPFEYRNHKANSQGKLLFYKHISASMLKVRTQLYYGM